MFLSLLSCKEEKPKYYFSFFDDVDKVEHVNYEDRAEWDDDLELKIGKNQINIPKSKIKSTKIISKEKFEDLFVLISTEYTNCSLMKCYDPRDILLFYKKNKLVGYYEFCKECGGNRTSNNLVSLPSFCREKGIDFEEILK